MAINKHGPGDGHIFLATVIPPSLRDANATAWRHTVSEWMEDRGHISLNKRTRDLSNRAEEKGRTQMLEYDFQKRATPT